jgi:hypothetical protein
MPDARLLQFGERRTTMNDPATSHQLPILLPSVYRQGQSDFRPLPIQTFSAKTDGYNADTYEQARKQIAEELLRSPKPVSVNIKPTCRGAKVYINIHMPMEYAFLAFTHGSSRFNPCWLHDYSGDAPEGVIECADEGLWLALVQSPHGNKLDHHNNRARARCTLAVPPGYAINKSYAGRARKFACETHKVLFIQIKREAFSEQNSTMNKTTKTAINSLTGQMEKIYNALPIQMYWSVNQIKAELYRNGHTIGHKHLMGCLRSLCEQGLILEPKPLMFTKNNKAADSKTSQPATSDTPEAKQLHDAFYATCITPTIEEETIMKATIKKSPMELLADLSEKARQFANELDNAALEIEQEFQNSEAKSEQLKQLKSLLKGIAD